MHARSQAHRRLTTLNLADGGFVEAMKKKLGFGGPPESMTEKFARQDRDLAAKIAARGPAPTAAAAPVPPPAPAPEPEQEAKRESAAARLGGLNLDAIKRREEAAGLKHGGSVPRQGGVIRGPGTARSDSIPARMKPGSFVLPADSTKRLSNVRVSNGESAFPPDVVQRIGAAALLAMRDVTHAPGGGARRPQRLASGGEVEDQKPSSFGDAAAAASNSGVTQVGPSPSVPAATPEPASAPTPAPVSAPSTPIGTGGSGNSFGDAAAFSQDSSVQQVGASPSGSSFGSQLSSVGGAIADGLGEAAKAVTSYPTSSDGKGYGLSRAIDETTPFGSSSAPSPAATAGGQQQPFSDARLDTQRPPGRNPEDPYGPKTTFNGPVDSPPTSNNITRVGNSYGGTGTITDGATINGMKYGDSGVKPVISDSNMQAANALDARERLASVGRVQAGGGGGGPATDARQLGSQVGWAGDPSNPQVYTKSATERLGTYGNMNLTPALFADKFGGRALDSRLAHEQGAINAERTDATNRANTQTQAAVARGAQAITAQSNLANQQQDQREFGLKSTSAGIDARSKLNMAGAQEAYMNAKTPEARANALSTLQGLSGHTPAPKFTVLRGRRDADGNTEGDQAVNNSTGQFLQPPAPQRTVPPAAISMLRSNPKMAAQFDSWYGPGSSAKHLGGR